VSSGPATAIGGGINAAHPCRSRSARAGVHTCAPGRSGRQVDVGHRSVCRLINAAPGSSLLPIINVGGTVGDFLFEGLPDGVGLMPGRYPGTVDVFVAHEQTTVPFFGERDFQDASVSRLTVLSRGRHAGTIVEASVPLGPEEDSSASAPPSRPGRMKASSTTRSS